MYFSGTCISIIYINLRLLLIFRILISSNTLVLIVFELFELAIALILWNREIPVMDSSEQMDVSSAKPLI